MRKAGGVCCFHDGIDGKSGRQDLRSIKNDGAEALIELGRKSFVVAERQAEAEGTAKKDDARMKRREGRIAVTQGIDGKRFPPKRQEIQAVRSTGAFAEGSNGYACVRFACG